MIAEKKAILAGSEFGCSHVVPEYIDFAWALQTQLQFLLFH
jgi:hypothetical protein